MKGPHDASRDIFRYLRHAAADIDAIIFHAAATVFKADFRFIYTFHYFRMMPMLPRLLPLLITPIAYLLITPLDGFRRRHDDYCRRCSSPPLILLPH